ncbi:hypothetical protein EVAR_68001_1 [Eumeta japonica]|uniref:Uncharacterized protein n=1 Tax=Eumeta variegata TaxID=151549 RepID=A0A4C2A0Y2_EUMVA|nr:hypothetical protein EVAR_68001_1 [Eumeta japonica]
MYILKVIHPKQRCYATCACLFSWQSGHEKVFNQSFADSWTPQQMNYALKVMAKWIASSADLTIGHNRVHIKKCGIRSHTGNLISVQLRNIDFRHTFLADRPLVPDPHRALL